LRFAIYVQATQVSRYVGRDETRESAVFQVDTIPAIAGDCLTKKGYRGVAEECHAIPQIATDRTAAQLHGTRAHLDANRVIEKIRIGSLEVRPGTYVYPLSRIAFEDIITPRH